MIPAPQRAASALGKGGCYVLCIFRWAEKIADIEVDVLQEFFDAVARGRVGPDGYVAQPGVLLGDLAGGYWTVLKAGTGADSAGRPYDIPLSYQPRVGEFEVQRWEVSGDDGGHFVLPDWDPYGESRAVREGQMVSKRIFRRVA